MLVFPVFIIIICGVFWGFFVVGFFLFFGGEGGGERLLNRFDYFI